MKKNLLTITLLLVAVFTKAQVIIDTVSLGAGYANQVWYSLQNDNQGSVPKNNWDIAFETSGQGTSILINSITGTTLFQYPTADTTGWNTFDSTGCQSWHKRWNADTSWSMGAMGRYATANPFDLDWGIYNSTTHFVTGDSLYLIKLANGSYKKLWIKSLQSGVYSFSYADINGTNLQNMTIAKSTYSTQNFAYFSIQTNSALSREPASASWDLVFTQYTAFIPTPYTVTGILQNKGVRVAEIKPIASPSTYVNWGSHTFKTGINEIGYDWKVFTSSFVIEDSLVYFVRAKDGAMWKVIPTGFGGSANGNNIFSKEKLSGVGINEVNGNELATLSIYPNPSNGNDVKLLIATGELSQAPVVSIMDIKGKQINVFELEGLINNDMNIVPLKVNCLSNGVYIINVKIGSSSVNQKMIINK